MKLRNILFRGVLVLGLCGGGINAFADVINFESYSGPPVFSEATPATLDVTTSIGTVVVSGGAILTNTANLPADETSVYGTAFFGGTGYSQTITLTFPSVIHNFFLNLYNGETYTDMFTVADNDGHNASFNIDSNLNGGVSLVSFPAVGTQVTITTTDPSWDFFIDNVGFNQSTPGSAPEPASLGFIALGGLGLIAASRLKRKA